MVQEHTKFKLFTKEYSSEEHINQLLEEIEKWVSNEKIAPKSIGVEFLEKAKYIVMSIGYRDDEDYNVKLSCSHIDKIELNVDYSKIENKMSDAASKHKNIICHELFITDSNNFYMIFMTKI